MVATIFTILPTAFLLPFSLFLSVLLTPQENKRIRREVRKEVSMSEMEKAGEVKEEK